MKKGFPGTRLWAVSPVFCEEKGGRCEPETEGFSGKSAGGERMRKGPEKMEKQLRAEKKKSGLTPGKNWFIMGWIL